jgi:hypothetical protein
MRYYKTRHDSDSGQEVAKPQSDLLARQGERSFQDSEPSAVALRECVCS